MKSIPHIVSDGGRIGFAPNEKLDCTVRAFAIATGMTYGDAHTVIKREGRKDRHTVWFRTIIRKSLSARIWNGKMFDEQHDTEMTIGQFVNMHPTGRYLIEIRSHVVAMIDGTIYDITPPRPKQKVIAAWELVSIPGQ